MATAILMPKQGNTVEECILVAWKKRRGDKVSMGEVIADIETDKAAFELESPAAGELLDTFFEDGDIVPVLINIGVIGEPGEDTESFRPAAPAAASPPPDTSARQTQAPDPAGKPSTGAGAPPEMATAGPPAAQAFLSPRAAKIPGAQQLPAEGIQGSGPGGRILESDAIHYLKTRPKLSFAAQRMVQQEEYRMPREGSGINNMILTGDLMPPGKALSRFRQVVATRMRASLAESAQFTLNASADARPILAARKTIKAQKGKSGFVDININDIVMHVVIQTLTSYPDLNAEFIDGKVYIHEDVDIAFACDTPKGLLVPVIRKSQSLSLPDLARRLKHLAEQAQTGQVPPDELSGGSLTVSNLGAMGIEHFTPIINPPQVAILGVCAITPHPVRGKDGTIQFIDKIGLSLTIDHQAVDGAPAARFLQTLCLNIAQFKL